MYRAWGLLCLTALAAATAAAASGTPDFGPEAPIFTPAMPVAEMQAKIDAIFAIQKNSEFGPARNAILFTPGKYAVNVPVGYYTQVLGVGATPDAVRIAGDVRSDATRPNNNATCTFWRGVEGFSVEPAGGTMQWAVSQAVPFRRMHVLGGIVLHQKGGWASGGWMADSLIDGTVAAGPQQQWISRNTEWGQWTGANWNMVFVGVNRPPEGEWPNPPYTKIPAVPVVREKPFLMVDKSGEWGMRVPELRANSAGITWHAGVTAGEWIPISRFYIARPGDTAAAINAQLASGKHLILTPGIYRLTEPIRVTRASTVVYGLGFATLVPVNGTAAMTVADVDGVSIAGILFDAGTENSPVLLEVGPEGSRRDHAKHPIGLFDVFFRVGGAGPAKAAVSLRINSRDTLVDHTWIWRADHGKGAGWTTNPAANGLVVNGDNVTIYGLFVEHYQEFQTLWNGNGGRVYFYQSEIPYDPPNQASYTSAAGVNGWASYKVADGVATHEAWGLGVYSVFRNQGVVLSRAFETPVKPGIRFHDLITVRLGNNGEISNVINATGGPTGKTPRDAPKVTLFP